MAFLQSDLPFGPQQTNIAGALQGPGVGGFQGGMFGQADIANLLRSLSTGTYGGGTGMAFPAGGALGTLGTQFAGAGGAGVSDIAGLMQALGLGGAQTAGSSSQLMQALGLGGAQSTAGLQQLMTALGLGGAGGAQDVSQLMESLGLGGGQGTAGLSQLMSALGLGISGQAGDWLSQAIGTETTGKLPEGAQEIVKQNLADRQAQLRGKYAQLGMTGSSAEASELDQAQRQSMQDQFTLSQSLGGLEAQQALGSRGQGLGLLQGAGGLMSGLTGLLGGAGNINTQLAQMLGGAGNLGGLLTGLLGGGGTLGAQLSGMLGGAGNLNAMLAQLGTGALSTSGSLGTTLGQLGLSGLNLSQQDYANLANEGLSALNIGAGIYGRLAQTQLGQDKQTTDMLGGFFKALMGTQGAFGSQGFIPGLQGFAGGGSAAALAGAPPGVEADLAFAALP